MDRELNRNVDHSKLLLCLSVQQSLTYFDFVVLVFHACVDFTSNYSYRICKTLYVIRAVVIFATAK